MLAVYETTGSSNANPGAGDDDEVPKGVSVVRKDRIHARNEIGSRHRPQSKQDHAGMGERLSHHQVAKVPIIRDDNTPLTYGVARISRSFSAAG